MIVVTGATGQLGSRIVERLLTRVPATSVGVSVRDVGRAAHLGDRGVRVRAGDFLEPHSLEAAFEGAQQVLVISAAIRGPGAVEANFAAIDAAVAAGVERVLYTSHQAASPTSLFPPMLTHAATEAHLAATGVPFTALRNGFYASTLQHHIGGAVESGRLALPADGPVSWTGHDDLADAAAAALAEPGLLDGASPPLTAAELVDFQDVATILGELSGRPVERVVISDEEWKANAVERGMPEPAAEFTLGMFRAARRGEFAVTDPTLEKVTGRSPSTVRTALEGYLHAFTR